MCARQLNVKRSSRVTALLEPSSLLVIHRRNHKTTNIWISEYLKHIDGKMFRRDDDGSKAGVKSNVAYAIFTPTHGDVAQTDRARGSYPGDASSSLAVLSN